MEKIKGEDRILNSLQNAFSDVPTKKPRARKLAAKITDAQSLPDNFDQVISNKQSIDLRVSPETNFGIEVISSVSAKKKDLQIKRFLSKKTEKVSRETSFQPAIKRRRSKKTSLMKRIGKVSGLVTSSFDFNISNIYASYRKAAATSMLVVGVLGLVVATTYVTYAYVAAKESDIVQKVEKHVVVPTLETPKIYIVQSEKSEIFQNPAFKGLKVGDNILTYANEGKVVIYRSSEDKIVNIINLNQN